MSAQSKAREIPRIALYSALAGPTSIAGGAAVYLCMKYLFVRVDLGIWLASVVLSVAVLVALSSKAALCAMSIRASTLRLFVVALLTAALVIPLMGWLMTALLQLGTSLNVAQEGGLLSGGLEIGSYLWVFAVAVLPGVSAVVAGLFSSVRLLLPVPTRRGGVMVLLSALSLLPQPLAAIGAVTLLLTSGTEAASLAVAGVFVAYVGPPLALCQALSVSWDRRTDRDESPGVAADSLDRI